MAIAYKRSIISNTLGITEKRIKQLTEQGIFKEVSPGHYGIVESVQAYVKYLQNQISDKDYTSDYNTEKAKLTKAKREKEEAELQLLKGELHKSTDIELVMGNMLVSFRAKLLVIPNKVLPKIKNTKNDNEILEILKAEMEEVLGELSEYNLELFE